jgi:hypothetical protein
MVAATATARVSAARSTALLADQDPDDRAVLRTLDDAQVRAALTARPLDQRIVNVAMTRAVDQKGPTATAPWIAVVSRLGWRDTAAIQNMLYVAANRNDIARVLDLGDALMRRRQLTDQMIPVLSAAETDPQVRGTFITRLVGQPEWRNTYLTATGHLRTREQLTARYALLRELQRRGSPPAWSEMVQNIRALEQAGLYDLAFSLWQSSHRGVTRPLDDTHFAQVADSFRLGSEEPIAFQWQIPAGEGFNTGVSTEGGRPTLDIDWNGRGVPVFAQQRTSAMPGRYGLDIGVDPARLADLKALDFKLMCADQPVLFQQDSQRPTRFLAQRATPCAYPVLQISGSIRAGATPHQISLRSVTLRRLGDMGGQG